MKITDFIFRYKTNAAICQTGICRVRIFVNVQKNAIYTVLSELDENTSSSVTNSIELIAAQLMSQQKIPKETIIIDHFPGKRGYQSDKMDIVSFDAFGRPSWSHISYQKCLQILGCTEKEFLNYREDKRVQREIYDALRGAPQWKSFEYTEDPDIAQRRLEIKNKQFSRKEIDEILSRNLSEKEMSSFIKKDMSLLAEVYAYPEDEYICFSEFPVGDGRADFVVFTGRSRMNVYIIEIKGADIALRRKNNYGALRASVQEGKEQLEKRAKYCIENNEKFRRFTYDVLEMVEDKKKPYNAFLGLIYMLNVDPQKDIHLSYVLIAGRTSDDLNDSKKRNTLEISSGLDVRIETWDSWFNKLKR